MSCGKWDVTCGKWDMIRWQRGLGGWGTGSVALLSMSHFRSVLAPRGSRRWDMIRWEWDMTCGKWDMI